MRWSNLAAVLVAAVLPGCDGLFTGDAVTRFPLVTNGRGGYSPVRLALGPEMNPVALNLHARTSANSAEAGKWNTYRAILSKAGSPVAEQSFHVNNTSTTDSPTAQTISRTMMVVNVSEVADYELVIDATGPLAVTLEEAQLELRKNVRAEASK